MVKALVVAFNKEKALVGDFSRQCETSRRFVDSSDLNPIHVTCPLRSGSVEVTYGAGAGDRVDMEYDCYCCLAGPRPSLSRVEASRGGPRLSETWPTAHWAPVSSSQSEISRPPRHSSAASSHPCELFSQYSQKILLGPFPCWKCLAVVVLNARRLNGNEWGMNLESLFHYSNASFKDLC